MNAASIFIAFVNAAWQSILLTAVVALVAKSARRLSASTQYGIWAIVLCATVALPFVNLQFAPPAENVTVATAAPVPVQHFKTRSTVKALPEVRSVAKTAPAFNLRRSVLDIELALLAQVPRLIWIWALVAATLLTLLAIDTARVLFARRNVREFLRDVGFIPSGARAFRIMISDSIPTPCVLGFASPLVVLPADLAEHASDEDLRAVLLHEQAHVSRFDDWQNLMQRIIAALLWFNPSVYFAQRELSVTREQACDDAAAASVRERLTYARLLAAVAASAQPRNAAVPGFLLGRKQTLRRIEQLVDAAYSHSVRMNARFIGVVAVAVIACIALSLRLQLPVVAQSISVATHSVSLAKQSLTIAKKSLAAVHAATKRAPLCLICEQPHAVVALQRKLAAPARTNRKSAAQAPHASQTNLTPVPSAGSEAPVARSYGSGSSWGAGSSSSSAPRAIASSSKNGDLLDALAADGYQYLAADDLIALRDNGVSGDFIHAAHAYGGKSFKVAEIVTMTQHGISPTYLANLSSVGLTGLPSGDIVRLADNGIRSSYAGAIVHALGRVPIDEILSLASRGVQSSYVQGLVDRGFHFTSAEIEALSERGVSLHYIDSVRVVLKSLPTVPDLLRLHDSGYTPALPQRTSPTE